MKRLTLAIDFDNTIVEEKYPAIGNLLPGAKEHINKLYADGHFIIIWTCRCDNYQLEAEHFLHLNGINYHKINENQPGRILTYKGLNCRKVSADIYIDDRNLGGIPSWWEIYDKIREIASHGVDIVIDED
jgi:hypothetical protein